MKESEFYKSLIHSLDSFYINRTSKKRGIKMKRPLYYLQCTVFALGGILGSFLGGKDGLLYTLVLFVMLDYASGILNAIDKRKLSSAVGYHGIAKKVFIFFLIGLANGIDQYILGHAGVLRSTVIFFYISNEGISILENASNLGVPIPVKIKEGLRQLESKGENSQDTNN